MRSKSVHSLVHFFLRKIIPHPVELAEHWKSLDEMHMVSDTLPSYLKALMLELVEKQLSRGEMWECIEQLGRRIRKRQANVTRANLDEELISALERNIVEERGGRFSLTPAGSEIAEHLQNVIPFFVEHFFSAKVVAVVTIVVHVLLSVMKLAFGFLSGSAGLISDGIDNTADTVSSVVVWLGIVFDKERLVAMFIIFMMFISVGGVGIASYGKITRPEPINNGAGSLVISLICGFIMLLLSAYQYAVGKRKASFALMCQAVDSRNHFLTSLLVCGGIVLSFLSSAFHASWLNYADAAASAIIGILILKSAVELIIEFVKPANEEIEISHFWRSAQEKVKRTVIMAWLSEQLGEIRLTKEQLEERFAADFCVDAPKIVTLSGMGYHPESSKDLLAYLSLFVKSNRLVFADGKYEINS